MAEARAEGVGGTEALLLLLLRGPEGERDAVALLLEENVPLRELPAESDNEPVLLLLALRELLGVTEETKELLAATERVKRELKEGTGEAEVLLLAVGEEEELL